MLHTEFWLFHPRACLDLLTELGSHNITSEIEFEHGVFSSYKYPGIQFPILALYCKSSSKVSLEITEE